MLGTAEWVHEPSPLAERSIAMKLPHAFLTTLATAALLGATWSSPPAVAADPAGSARERSAAVRGHAVIRARQLVVRVAPDLSTPAVDRVRRGDRLAVVDEWKDWVKVVTPSAEGWVARPFVTYEPAATYVPEVLAEDPGNAVVAARLVEVRSGPWPDAPLVDKLTVGERVEVVELGDGWVRVRAGFSEGWVPRDVLRLAAGVQPPTEDAPEPSADAARGARGTTATQPRGAVAARHDSEQAARASGRAGRAEVAPGVETVSEGARVRRRLLAVRSSPSDTAPVIDRLQAGEAVSVVEQRGDWLRVVAGLGVTRGWVKASGVSGVEPRED